MFLIRRTLDASKRSYDGGSHICYRLLLYNSNLTTVILLPSISLTSASTLFAPFCKSRTMRYCQLSTPRASRALLKDLPSFLVLVFSNLLFPLPLDRIHFHHMFPLEIDQLGR